MLTSVNSGLKILKKKELVERIPSFDHLSIEHDGRPLVEGSPAPLRKLFVSGQGKDWDDVQECFDWAGLRKVDLHYDPTPGPAMSSTIQIANSEEFRQFFHEMQKGEAEFQNGQGSAALVLDTNVIYRHYASNLLIPAIGGTGYQIGYPPVIYPVRIPRLVLLEVERCYNESDSDKKDEASRKKRLALFAIKEIMLLRDLGAKLLPPLQDSTLESFSRISGEKFTDAWIRREVATVNEPVIFATCDLMNALAATAEGFAVVYFSRGEEVDAYRFEEISQVANLIVALAISFNKIKIGNLTFEGMWAGKTTRDWDDESLRLSS